MAFGTFLVGSLRGGLKQLFVMIQIFRAVEILQVVLYFLLNMLGELHVFLFPKVLLMNVKKKILEL